MSAASLLPSTHLMAALDEAQRRGHAVAHSIHVLLALIDASRPSIAGDALRSAGVDATTIGTLAGCIYTTETAGQPTATAAGADWHAISGRAEAFAAALGDGRVTAEHVLLGLVWPPDTLVAHALVACGTDRETILAGLRERGLVVPTAALPPLPAPMTQAAVFPLAHLQAVTRAMWERAPDLRWGIGNSHPDGVTVIAGEGTDLASILDSVVGADRWSWREPDAPAPRPRAAG